MLACQRNLFSLPDDLHYLNGASRTPLLKTAEAAGIAQLQRQRVPTSTPPEAYFQPAEELRQRIGRLIHASAEAIAFIPAVSYGAAIVARHVTLSAGQNVVMPGQEFPSDVYAWMGRCEAAGAELRFVERPSGMSGMSDVARTWNDRLLESIDAKTAVVHLSSVHWTDGLRFDLAAIGERAREVGAWFIVDGTQSIGAAPFDFEAVQADLVVCSGYKWLLGPYQLGFAAFGERLLEAEPLEEHWSNRAGSQDVRDIDYKREYRAGARRFDLGEHAVPITLPMLSDGVRQALEWGPDAVQEYCAELTRPLEALLTGEGIQALPAQDRVAHIIGLRVAAAERLPALMQALQERQVVVSQRGSSVRVSPHVYNTADDIAALCDGIADALGRA